MLIKQEINASKETFKPSNYLINLRGLKILKTLSILNVLSEFLSIAIESHYKFSKKIITEQITIAKSNIFQIFLK